ncbi:hypothetical protein [Comamonas sp.]|uniref:hypothetical protein n=1 Tax=Comamonas sp. TaxID=34028 RepID=UPI003D14640C
MSSMWDGLKPMATQSKRHNFSKSVINTLAERVTYRCSRPDCDVSTIGPAQDGGTSNTGTAAHITAASPGGPRYDPTLTPEQRKSAENGIWLCAIHGREIDSDKTRYTVDELKQWKSSAESNALLRQNKRQPREEDAANLLKLAAGAQPKAYVPTGIKNVHLGIKELLHDLDPRLDISTSYNDGITSYRVGSVKEPVALNFNIDGQFDPDDFDKQFKQLRDHGAPIKLENVRLDVSGSAAVKSILDEPTRGKFVIEPIAKIGEVNMLLTSVDGNSNIEYSRLPCTHQAGDVSGTFKWELFEQLLTLQATVARTSPPLKLIANIDLQSWNGKSLFKLPNYDKLLKFVKLCANSCTVKIDIELANHPTLNIPCFSWDKENLIRETLTTLTFLSHLKTVAQFSNKDLTVDFSSPIPEEEVKKIYKLGEFYALNGKCNKSVQLTIGMYMNSNANKLQIGTQKRNHIQALHPPVEISVFGENFSTPPADIKLTEAEVELIRQPGNSLTAKITSTADSFIEIAPINNLINN